jgi:hypothetical protein
MEPKYVNPQWAKAIQWIALISYLFVALYYFAFLPHYFQVGWIEGLIYTVVAIGFSLLVFSATLKLKKLEKDVANIEIPSFLFDPYSTTGWGLITLHFLAILLLPSSVHFIYYYIFALFGYFLVSQSYILGCYLIVIFYIFSILYHHYNHGWIDYLVILSKITIAMYMGTFAYIDYKKRMTL